MGISLNSIKMYVKGFKKVPLKDVKGALNETNNFKWVKSKKGLTTTILSTGTKIEDYTNGRKVIERANDIKRLVKAGSLQGEYIIWTSDKKPVNGIYNNVKILKQRTKEDVLKEKAEKAIAALNKKRQNFIKHFNNNYSREIINNENGRIKIIRENKTGNIVSWFSKPKNSDKTSSGINIYYPAGFGHESLVQTKDKFMVQQILKDPLSGKQSTKTEEIPLDIFD